MGDLGVSKVGKPRRKFSEELKRAAVEDYVSGRKTAAQIAAENEVSVSHVYKWKIQFDENAKGSRVDELESSGVSREHAKELLEIKAERDAYQRMVGEQAVIIELLKKRLLSTNSQQRSELTGLIETLERAALKRKRGL
jgi:transposase-like protein